MIDNITDSVRAALARVLALFIDTGLGRRALRIALATDN
jgi:hypothetical protein